MSIRERIRMINESVEDEVDFDRFAHPVDSDEDEVEIDADEKEDKDETTDDVIKRAVTEEEGAIATYDEILGLLGENDGDLTEMIQEIKKDEEDHLALLNHYVDTGDVWTDEDLKAQKEKEASGEEQETEDMVEESDDLLESDANAEFISDLSNLLKKYCRVSIDGLGLSEDGNTVTIKYSNGSTKDVSIEGDSNVAAIRDILKNF